MKKYMLILMLILICQVGKSQTMDDLFNEFTKTEQVKHVKIHYDEIEELGIKQIKVTTPDMGINAIEILHTEGCTPKTKKRFTKAIRELDDPRFETIVTFNEKDNRCKVLVRVEGETIRELVLLRTGGNDDDNLIRIKGKIKSSDIDKMIASLW